MVFKKFWKTDYILYCFILVAFYLLNRFSLFITDDFYYAFIMHGNLPNHTSFVPIDNLADIWNSQCYAYFHHNGRFLVHSIVQLFCGILGIRVFAVFNSFIFVLLVAGITKCVRHYNGPCQCDVILATLLLFLFIPIFGKTYLGNISFAVNYLWTSCAVIWWYYFYISKKRLNKIANIALFVFSVLVGSMQESFSIGIAGALGIYYLFNIKELKGTKAYLVLGFILGSCLVVLAPANFVRFDNAPESSYSIKQKFLQIVRVGLSLRMFFIMILCFSLLLVKQSKEVFNDIFKRNAILILASIINVAFAALVAMKGKHQLVSVELFSILVVILLLYNFRTFVSENQLKLSWLCFAVLLMLYGPIYKCRQTYHDAYLTVVENAKHSKDGIVVGKEYESLCAGYSGWLAERFAMREQLSWDFNIKGLSLMLSNGNDSSLVKLILPDSLENIAELCIEENQVGNYVYKAKNLGYYVVRIKPDDLSNKKISLYLESGVLGKHFNKLVNKGSALPDKEYSMTKDNTCSFDDYLYHVVSSSSPIKTVIVY